MLDYELFLEGTDLLEAVEFEAHFSRADYDRQERNSNPDREQQHIPPEKKQRSNKRTKPKILEPKTKDSRRD